MPDDYEIVPEDEIEQMKQEIRKLKTKNPRVALDSSFTSLQKSIDRLNEILSAASQSMSEEPETHHIIEKLNTIMDQNEKIAKGMVTIIDILNEKRGFERPHIVPPVSQRPEPPFPPSPPRPPTDLGSAPPFPPPRDMPPEFGPPVPPIGPKPQVLPPLKPTPKPRKKGLFGGMFKK